MAIAAQPGGAPKRARRIYYPVRDNDPLGETDLHRDITIYVIEALKARYADQPDIYISGDNFIYYEEGNPKKVVSPDAYVVFGVPMRQRETFMTWKEGGRLPGVVFEITSKKSKKEDTQTKRFLYETVLRVPEYFLFDPTGDYLAPRLQGFRLQAGQYVRLPLVENRLRSDLLGLELVEEGHLLRLYDPVQQRWLPSREELEERAEAAVERAEQEALQAMEWKQRVETEALRAEAAEAENARLKAELEALKRERQ